MFDIYIDTHIECRCQTSTLNAILFKMRKEPFTIGDFIHVYNRGNRKMPIVHDDNDKWRFLKILCYFNDEFSPQNIFRELSYLIESGGCQRFEWPQNWPKQKPLVKILAYHLSPNHFHLLLKEIAEGGVSRFMKKFSNGFTNYSNTKYNEVGSVFQGSYKARTINNVKHLQYIDAYIQVFNAFELRPGGIETALKEFNEAFDFALEYPFCSIGESFGRRRVNILDRDIFKEVFSDLDMYKKFVYEALMVRNIREVLGKLTLD